MQAKRGVAYVIHNRAVRPSWWGTGYAGVILKPLQFSSFNKNDPNAALLPLPGDSVWRECLEAAQEVMSEGIVGDGRDPTDGATHYHDVSIAAPEWTKSMTRTEQIGRLIFYKEQAN